MRQIFSKAVKPTATSSMTLKSIFHVQADSSYHVKRNTIQNGKGVVFIRTLEGHGCISLNGSEPLQLTANTLLFAETKNILEYMCCSKMWNFWWMAAELDRDINLPKNSLINISPAYQEMQELKSCLELLQRKDETSTALASATLSLIVYRWSHSFNRKPEKLDIHQKDVEKVIAFLHEKLGENINIKVMSEICGLAERRFREVFVNIVGISPKKYYDNLRIDMAEDLLSKTSLSVKEIAYKLGYNTQFQFSKAYKKYKGMSPLHYRQN